MQKPTFNTKLTPDNKALRDYLIREITKYKKLSKSALLDIGCGNGRFGQLLHKFVKSYYGTDPNKKYVQLAKRNAKTIKNINYKIGKAEKIPFKNKFDIILYSFSWHFIKNYPEALKELNRISTEEGIIIILEPALSPAGYKDQRLNANSAEFVQGLWDKKLKQLKTAKSFLEKQKKFKILEFKGGRVNLWILKKWKK